MVDEECDIANINLLFPCHLSIISITLVNMDHYSEQGDLFVQISQHIYFTRVKLLEIMISLCIITELRC